MEMLRIINFGPDDTLYILGDVIDRGKESIKCLQYIMAAPNIKMLMGNHEQMMIDALTGDCNDVSHHMLNWLENGGTEVFPEFCKLPEDEQVAIMDYVANLPYLAEVKIGEQNFVLVHAGLNVVDNRAKDGAVTTAAVLSEQNYDDMVWIRKKFFRRKALPKSIIVFGHTPIPLLKKHNGSGVWRDKRFQDKIGVDGACVFGGCLLALRLDDLKEFSVKKQ